MTVESKEWLEAYARYKAFVATPIGKAFQEFEHAASTEGMGSPRERAAMKVFLPLLYAAADIPVTPTPCAFTEEINGGDGNVIEHRCQEMAVRLINHVPFCKDHPGEPT
jgi:hypothetical protein